MNLWMLTAILTCGLGMMLTSCSDSDDNYNDKDKEIVNPATDDDGYTIEVEAGLTLPENEFNTKVPAATNFDQNIVNALKAIDKVTDVKPFTMVHQAGHRPQRSLEGLVQAAVRAHRGRQGPSHRAADRGLCLRQCRWLQEPSGQYLRADTGRRTQRQLPAGGAPLFRMVAA